MEPTTIAVDMQSPLDLAIGSSSGAQKTEGNYCTICCTIPDAGGMARGIIGNLVDLT